MEKEGEKKPEEKIILNPILETKEPLEEDESIVGYNIYAFNPVSGSQLNNPGNITITVNNSDDFYHPSHSWLEFEGQVIKEAGTNYTKDQMISFVNYGILYLFDQMKYCLNSSPIDVVFNPGFVANIFGLATFPDNYKPGLIEGWAPDTSEEITDNNLGFKARRDLILASEPDPIGVFRFSIPLKRVFGFADDYGKIMYGFTHNLILTKSSSDDNALVHTAWEDPLKKKDAEIDAGKVNLSNIRWMLPRVRVSDVAKFILQEQIRNRIILDCGFRMRQHISIDVAGGNTFTWRLGVRSSPEQPRFIFLAFQTKRSENQSYNNGIYDHCDLTSAHVLMNNDRYPVNDFETNFKKNYFDNFYNELVDFRKKFYGIDGIISSSCVGPMEFKRRFPIYCFDVSKQSERLKSGVTDITLHCRFGTDVETPTVAHVMMISDRKLKFESDGVKMSVVY